jgi:hypothetical protein
MAQQIQLRRGNASEWTASNPILLQGEIGVELDTQFYKIGDGVKRWNDIPYAILRTVDSINVAQLGNQSTPTTPTGSNLKFYAKDIAGRMMLRQLGPSGLSTPLQPSFFQNFITMINTNTTTSVGAIGNTVTSVGTLSHPVVTEKYGYMTNFASAATVGATCGTGNNGLLWLRGENGQGGFFYSARIAFPDIAYADTRFFAGFTSSTMAQSVGADQPAHQRAGFSLLTETETNIHFSSINGIAIQEDRANTEMEFTPECVYDFYIFCAPSGNSIGWRVDNVTLGTSKEGSSSTTLPTGSSLMRAGFQLATLTAIARNIRMQRVYVESDT